MGRGEVVISSSMPPRAPSGVIAAEVGTQRPGPVTPGPFGEVDARLGVAVAGAQIGSGETPRLFGLSANWFIRLEWAERDHDEGLG